MTRAARKGAEEARNQLLDLLAAAEYRERPLLPLKGTGSGLWGEDSRRALRELRDEWNR